jgi:membrane protein YqaA with SNARE-associated domain
LEAVRAMKKRFMQFLDSMIKKNAMIGVFIGMFLESSFVPIPSEAVLLAFGTAVPVRVVTIAGTLGSTAGSVVGYYIGQKGGRPLVKAIGPYISVTLEKVDKAAGLFERYEDVPKRMHERFQKVPFWIFATIISPAGLIVLISRCIPFVPFKVFSISSGLLNLPLAPFILYTFLGAIPRCFVLATIGKKLERYKKPVLLSILALVVLYLAYEIVKVNFLAH